MGKRKSDAAENVNSQDKKSTKLDDEKPKTNESIKSKELPQLKTTTTDDRDATVKIVTWNVSGLKACVKKSLVDYIKQEDADIVCLQETKCIEKEIPNEVKTLSSEKDSKNGYHMYWCNGEKKGYAGVALWSKVKPISVVNGMGIAEHDNEGRTITAEYDNFYLVTVYVPNSQRKLARLDYRGTWENAVLDYLKKLKSSKPVVYCGDLNVAHEEIDLKNPKTNKKNAGFSQEERGWFTHLLSNGYVDTYRHLNPGLAGAYTFWTYMMNARAKDVGWRLDYFVVSEDLKQDVCDCAIRKYVMGSDHCPLAITMAL